MISRLWHGWTSPDNADAYEKLIRQTIFPGIAGRQIEGFHRIELLRRPPRDEIEFITIMWFNYWEAVRRIRRPRLGNLRRPRRRPRLAVAVRREGAA